METHILSAELQTQWINGNRDHVIRKLSELKPIVASAVAAHIVLSLHDGYKTDLALFLSRLDDFAGSVLEEN